MISEIQSLSFISKRAMGKFEMQIEKKKKKKIPELRC